MQEVSSLYREIASGNYTVETRVAIGDTGLLINEDGDYITFGGTRILVAPSDAEDGYDETVLSEVTTSGSLFSGDEPGVGACVSREVNLKMLKPEREISGLQRIAVYSRITDGKKYSEWLPQGVYFLDSAEEDSEDESVRWVDIHGYDAMMFTEQDYPAETALSWPATDIDVVREIAAAMDVQVDSRTVAIMNMGYKVQYTAYSLREYLGYIAAMYAGCFIMSETGELRLVRFWDIPNGNAINVGRSYGTLTKEKQFDVYSKVTIVVDEDNKIEYSAGTVAGRTLTLSCPFGTKKMAEDILSKIKWYQYQPYSATGAHIDPATEIGDGITIGGIYGGVFTKDVIHGSMYTANVSAPGGEKINYKYEYKSQTDRKIQRQYKEMRATFTVQASQIAAEVSAREEQGRQLRASLDIQADRITQEVSDREEQGSELRATLTQQAELISAKVSKTGGSSSSFGWELTDSSWTLKSNNTTVLKATKSGLEITGSITATGGKIGGFDIQTNYLSYNGQTWGGTNTTGAYLGTSGLQLGKNFKVDMSGNLTAASGTFSGTVYAGSIQYGNNAGYLSGSGLSDGSIYGGKVAGSTLGTSKFTGGVNTTLGYADFSNGVFNGFNQATTMWASSFRVGSEGTQFTPQTISFVDGNGNARSYRVLMEADG